MKLVKHFMGDDALRHALNTLTRATFGFDFESWYAAGYWEGDYLPYAFEEDGRLLSNVSVNRMRFLQNGRERLYIQLGTVMTDPAYRRRGLASQLMREVLADWEGRCDGVYLFGDLDALPFYDSLGFSRGMQVRYTLRPGVLAQLRSRAGESGGFAPVDPGDAQMKARYMDAVRTGVPYAALGQLNRFSLTMFYTAGMEQVSYSPALDAFAVTRREGDGLVLQSVCCAQRHPLADVLARLHTDSGALSLGFAPCGGDAALFDAQPYDGGDDYRLFYRGDALRTFGADGLYFPELSHA